MDNLWKFAFERKTMTNVYMATTYFLALLNEDFCQSGTSNTNPIFTLINQPSKGFFDPNTLLAVIVFANQITLLVVEFPLPAMVAFLVEAFHI